MDKKKAQLTKSEIEAELKKFDEKIEDAKKSEGDTEVRDNTFDKAKFLKDKAMDYTEAEKVFRECYKLTGGASRKMEV
jgi:hypothetical protein